jgi:phosphoglycolate phosphatase-like HAD superfamily hydrolase
MLTIGIVVLLLLLAECIQRMMIMNLVMLDIDGTLTQSYEYDREIFGIAIAEVLECPLVNADLNGYIDKTSLGVTIEAIQRVTGNVPKARQIEEVKSKVLRYFEKMYLEGPGTFCEVPGASIFLERLRNLEEVGVAIATGCWRREAIFKLQASGLDVNGIPMATSDDDRNRQRIMKIATERALEFYGCPTFERVVYLGDGPWDLQASRTLGYRFIGIGPRVQDLKDSEGFKWHPNFLKIEAVIASVIEAMK